MILTKETFHHVIINTFISYASSHVLFLLSSIAAAVITVFFYWLNGAVEKVLVKDIFDKVVWETILLALVMEIIFAIVFRKFKIYIPAPGKRFTGRVLIALSGIVLVLYALSRHETLTGMGWTLFISGIVLCAAGFISSFKSETAIAYNEKVRELAEGRLKTELKEVQDTNNSLENAAHRDAKRLPAYHKAVEELIKNTPDGDGKDKAVRLLEELITVEQEQSREINSKLRKGKKLPSTGMVLLDNVFAHMLDRATQKDIDLDLIVGGNINGITALITQASLETLVADLIENAITAAEHGGDGYKSILVYLWVSSGVYELRVDENGLSFETDTLIQLGEHRITTHADTGGSGIGYMAIFEILHLCNASLIIVERPPTVYRLFKSVVIRFDGRSEKIIRTYRKEDFIKIRDGDWIIEDINEMSWQ